MQIKSTVRYNSDNERAGITVNAKRSLGTTAKFNVNDGTAVLTSVQQSDHEDSVYMDSVTRIMDYVGDLPFVETVELDEYDEDEHDV